MASDDARLQRLEASIGQLEVDVANTEGSGITGGGSPFERLDILTDTFPEQRAFVEDASKHKAAFCTRRGAKSYSVGTDFINDAKTHPYAAYLFAGLTRPVAKKFFWEEVLKPLERKFNIGIRFNTSELIAYLPNGARIEVVGGDASEDEQRKMLGGKRRKVCLDEAQSWKTNLGPMIYGTIGPSVVDLGGQVILTGTPGDMINGFFHDVTRGCSVGHLSPPDMREPGWSVHTWTTYQNLAIVDGVPMNVRWANEIADIKHTHGERIVEVPWFRQMYLGEWVVDTEARVYKYRADRNARTGALPIYKGGSWHFGVAIDLGFNDPNGFVLLAYHDWDRNLYILHTWKQWHMDFTATSERIHWYEEKVRREYRALLDFYVIDGANKQGVEEMRKRHNLPLTAAQKQAKNDYIELMNADFILGYIKVNTDTCCDGVVEGKHTLALTDEYESLIWDPKTLPGAKEWKHGTVRVEHPSCSNHLTDAGLYGWRHCYPYLANAPKPPVERGSEEWNRQEEERMREQAEDEMNERIRLAQEANGVDGPGLPDGSNWETWAK